jgi:hypothetical protein
VHLVAIDLVKSFDFDAGTFILFVPMANRWPKSDIKTVLVTAF